jgi:hypothetical protein
MARFASECLVKMNDRVKHLEAQLGTIGQEKLVFKYAPVSYGLSVFYFPRPGYWRFDHPSRFA